MQNTSSKSPTESPFFALLADADEVQIREIPSDGRKHQRSFYVHIKTPAPTPKPASATQTFNLTQLQKSAELLLENQDYLLARNLFSYLLQQNLRDAGGLRGLGICLFKLGEVVSSRKCFRALVELYQSDEAHYWLALGYQAENKDTLAAEHFDKIAHPETLTGDQRFDYHKLFGNCLTRLGLFDRAEGHYVKALELNPTSDTIHVNLGTLFVQRKQWAQAKERFARAAELNPGSSRAQCGLGLAAVALGDANAKSYFDKALDLDPQNLVALHQLLQLSTGQEEFPALKTRLRAFLEKDPNHADTHYALAALLFKEGSWKACEMHVARALEVQPQHERALKLRTDLASLVRNQNA